MHYSVHAGCANFVIDAGDFRHLVEIQEFTGKGKVIFAKANIPCGTRILVESPFLRSNETINDTLAQFYNLPAS
jgi:hypothetical protein